MTKIKVFIVGPHVPKRYKIIQDYVASFARKNAPKTSVEVISPLDNPSSDRFNDWIFGQIDTCDLLIADMTGFNPNVVYEVAFAHSLGTPCVYLQFTEGATSRKKALDISHYFKFSLISREKVDKPTPEVGSEQLATGSSDYLNMHLTQFFKGRYNSGETILSDYYGAFPADSEFMRGLAEGYYRNFLGSILESTPPPEDGGLELFIVIPDTFETTDKNIDQIKNSKLTNKYVLFPEAFNPVGRPLGLNRHESVDRSFFFDIPTTVLTVTESSKYRKISSAKYFSMEERDSLTDKLARKFVATTWDLIRRNRQRIKFPTSQIKFVWLSQLVGTWHENGKLMNSVPFDRPDGF
jgi:hypothetical protein